MLIKFKQTLQEIYCTVHYFMVQDLNVIKPLTYLVGYLGHVILYKLNSYKIKVNSLMSTKISFRQKLIKAETELKQQRLVIYVL